MTQEIIEERIKALEETLFNTKKHDITETPTLAKLYGALCKAQMEFEVAYKDTNNPFFKSKYADLTEVINCSRPALLKQGLAVIQRVMANGDGKNYLLTRLVHESGEWIESKMLLQAKDISMQAIGSAITYARRYSYAALVGVVVADEDDDGNRASKPPAAPKNSLTNEKPVNITISQKQSKDLLDEILSLNDEDLLDNILRHYNINSLAFLPSAEYPKLMKNLTTKKQGGNNGDY